MSADHISDDQLTDIYCIKVLSPFKKPYDTRDWLCVFFKFFEIFIVTQAPNTLAWLQSIGVSNVQTVEEAMKTPAIGEAIQKGIDRANARATSNAQRVVKWIVLPVDFSLPGGELGPTLKMKRHVVHEKNNKVIEDFYKS